ncbi:thermonuclease family protein [Aerococcaceae bacterium NML191292]|nr:thermonuclease family protein [Aerococcaceae bacterium NML191292]
MKRLFVTALTLLMLLFIPLSTAFAKITADSLGYKVLATPFNKQELKPVHRYAVIDGDTVKLDLGNETIIQANLLLIDAPELKEEQPFAQEAKKRLEQLIEKANRVEVEYDSGDKQDSSGFDLVYLWVDGILVQEILATEGFARLNYVFPPNTRYLTEIVESQSYAQLNSLAVWSRSNVFTSDVVGETVTYANVPSGQVQAPQGFVEPIQQAAAPTNVYYKNCAEVRAAGAAPIYPGDPGWDPKFDRDRDGVGCE